MPMPCSARVMAAALRPPLLLPPGILRIAPTAKMLPSSKIRVAPSMERSSARSLRGNLRKIQAWQGRAQQRGFAAGIVRQHIALADYFVQVAVQPVLRNSHQFILGDILSNALVTALVYHPRGNGICAEKADTRAFAPE